MGFIINPYRFAATPDTTADGKQVFMIIGESNAFGSGETQPSVPSAGTMFDSNGSVLTAIDSAFITGNVNGTARSQWIQFGIDYNSDSGKKIVIVNNGVSGSRFNSGTAGASWYTNGTLYPAAVTKTNNTLTLLGLTKPKAIFVCLGINDDGTLTLAHIQSLIDRLVADYSGVDIIFCQIGDDSVPSNPVSRRVLIRQAVINNSNCYIGATFSGLLGAGLYQAGSPHPTQAGYNISGAMYARWMKNNTYTKWARAIISCHVDELSTGRKTLIENWITSIGSLYLSNLAVVGLYKTSTVNNIFFDWTFLQEPQNPGAATFSVNDSIATNGTKYFTPGVRPNTTYVIGSLSDNFNMVKVKANSTAAGTLAYVFGGQFAGNQLTGIKQQAASNLRFSCVDGNNGITYSGQTAFQNDTAYACARNSGNELAYINGAVVAGPTTIAQNNTPVTLALGGLNTANTFPACTLASGITASFEYFVAGKESTMNHATLYAAMEALIDGW